jgi:flagellin
MSSVGDITLTSSIRQNLLSLQQTSDLLSQTQERLSTNKKVNSPLDNPNNYFLAQGQTQKADTLNSLKDNIGQTINVITNATNTATSIQSLVENIRSQITSARSARTSSTSASDLRGIASGIAQLIKQIDNLRIDAGFNGVNLFSKDTTVSVSFNETASTKLQFSGFNGTLSGLGLVASGVGVHAGGATFSSVSVSTIATAIFQSNSASGLSFLVSGTAIAAHQKTLAFNSASFTGQAGATALDNFNTGLNSLESKLQSNVTKLSINLSILTTRQSFITDTVNNLIDGSNKLTLADTNQESANMLALQTRQSLGITSLSLASQAAQGILRLF